jgi:hypothetical protein
MVMVRVDGHGGKAEIAVQLSPGKLIMALLPLNLTWNHIVFQGKATALHRQVVTTQLKINAPILLAVLRFRGSQEQACRVMALVD